MKTRYEELLKTSVQITSTLLDMEGGRFILAVMLEILEKQINVKDFDGRRIIFDELCEVVEIPPISFCSEKEIDLMIAFIREAMEA